MKEYKDVESYIKPEKKMSKTKVRIPSNIRKKKIEDESGNKSVIYIYDEVIYNTEEFQKVNDEQIQENLDVTMMAIDYSYMETSELLDVIMLAIDALYTEMMDVLDKLV